MDSLFNVVLKIYFVAKLKLAFTRNPQKYNTDFMKKSCLIHDVLFLPISTIESRVS